MLYPTFFLLIKYLFPVIYAGVGYYNINEGVGISKRTFPDHCNWNISGCELPNLCTRNWTRILCENSIRSQALSHLIGPFAHGLYLQSLQTLNLISFK